MRKRVLIITEDVKGDDRAYIDVVHEEMKVVLLDRFSLVTSLYNRPECVSETQRNTLEFRFLSQTCIYYINT